MRSNILPELAWLSLVMIFSLSSANAKSTLTWETCLKDLIQNNPELSASEEGVAVSAAKKRASFSGFFPQLAATANLNRDNSGIASDGSATPRDQFSIGIQATESIFSGFKDFYRVTRASHEIRLAKATQEAIKAKLSSDLKITFAALIYNQEQSVLAESISKRRRDNMRMVTLRYEGGRENKGSSLFSKASLEQALFEVLQIHRGTEVARLNLARVIGKTTELDFEVSGKLSWTPMEATIPFKPLVAQTPEHQQAEAQWQVAEAQSRIAQSDFYPELSLTGSYSKTGTIFPPNTPRWSVGVAIAFPFFPGGQNIFNYQSASAEARKADFTKNNTDNLILAKIQQMHAAFMDAIGLQKVAKEFLEASQVRAIISRGRYQAGLMTFEDWDLIETDLINRQKIELQSRRDVVFAEAALEQSQGKSAFP